MIPQPSETLVNSVFLWKNYYQELFNFNLNGAAMPAPDSELDKKQLIITVPKFTVNDIINTIKKFYDVNVLCTSQDLNTFVNQGRSVRSDATFPYGIFVEPYDEPDEELLYKSYIGLTNQGLKLEERLHYDLFSWWKNKEHIDPQFRTICAGSKYTNEMPPIVGWHKKNQQLIIDTFYTSNNFFGKYYMRNVVAEPEISLEINYWKGMSRN